MLHKIGKQKMQGGSYGVRVREQGEPQSSISALMSTFIRLESTYWLELNRKLDEDFMIRCYGQRSTFNPETSRLKSTPAVQTYQHIAPSKPIGGPQGVQMRLERAVLTAEPLRAA